MSTGARTKPGPLSRALAAILDDAFRSSRFASQAALGTASGLSQSQVSKYLLAERTLNVEELAALCIALDLDIAQVVREADRARRV